MQVLTILGALDGVSPCPMSILKKNNVALSDVRDAPVTLILGIHFHVGLLHVHDEMDNNLGRNPYLCAMAEVGVGSFDPSREREVSENQGLMFLKRIYVLPAITYLVI